MKRIVVLVIFIFLLGMSVACAGQEEPCNHNSYIVTYNSNDEKFLNET